MILQQQLGMPGCPSLISDSTSEIPLYNRQNGTTENLTYDGYNVLSNRIYKKVEQEIPKDSNTIPELENEVVGGQVNIGDTVVIGTGDKQERVIIDSIANNIPTVSPAFNNSHAVGTLILSGNCEFNNSMTKVDSGSMPNKSLSFSECKAYAKENGYNWAGRSSEVAPSTRPVWQQNLRTCYGTLAQWSWGNTSKLCMGNDSPSGCVYQTWGNRVWFNDYDKEILNIGSLGSFDDNGVTPSCILNFENKKYLYYIGWNSG